MRSFDCADCTMLHKVIAHLEEKLERSESDRLRWERRIRFLEDKLNVIRRILP